jgi:hypothetical protein
MRKSPPFGKRLGFGTRAPFQKILQALDKLLGLGHLLIHGISKNRPLPDKVLTAAAESRPVRVVEHPGEV